MRKFYIALIVAMVVAAASLGAAFAFNGDDDGPVIVGDTLLCGGTILSPSVIVGVPTALNVQGGIVYIRMADGYLKATGSAPNIWLNRRALFEFDDANQLVRYGGVPNDLSECPAPVSSDDE